MSTFHSQSAGCEPLVLYRMGSLLAREIGRSPCPLSIPIRHAVGMDSELVKLLGNPGELPADH
ncbi:MAG: hypothetical protein HC936_00180 [Leptolyngbyaceae cyanobacterium SU_3_3]|nr:hypothetical protein [Leptolyngbyaceae cyanobacterium SU_3_3]